LKLIIARATAGDAIWFRATIDRIADILARQGDTDPVEVRRSKAIGILAQPAEALQLLCRHQDDDWDGAAEATDPKQEPTEDDDRVGIVEAEERVEPASEPPSVPEATHQSLQLTSPPFDPERARPRAVVYVHLSQEALTAGTGVARVEDVGPVLLGRLRSLLGDRCRISVKPVIDLPAGHTPVDCYEIPARLREQLQLRCHAGWQVRQPEPGTWLWRSPHRRIYLVNATGTHPLGHSVFAEAIWHAAASSQRCRRADPDSIVSQWELRRLLVGGSDDPARARKPLHDPGRA
jgi:hypothetical protein